MVNKSSTPATRRNSLRIIVMSAFALNTCEIKAQSKSPNIGVRTDANKVALQRADIANELLAQFQRAIRLYMQEVLDIDGEKSKTAIAQSINRSSALIDRFRTLNPDAEEAQTIGQIDSLWGQLIRPLSGEASKSQLGVIFALNSQILEQCERLEAEIAKDYNHGKGDVLNLLGHQAMLSQRIAANHFLLQLDLSRSNLRSLVAADLNKFHAVSNELSALAESSSATKQLYELIQVQVILYRSQILKGGNSKMELQSIGRGSERLFELLMQFMREMEKT